MFSESVPSQQTQIICYLLEPGMLQFEKRGHLVKESVGNALITVIRQNGADGDISVKWKTIDKSAVNGKDYTGGEGVLEFNHGEVKNGKLKRLQCHIF